MRTGLLLLMLLTPGLSAAQAPTDVTPQILELERQGRGRPRESAAELERLKSRTGSRDAQRLELLTVLGLMLATPSEADAPERPAVELDEWSRDTTAANREMAGAAARLIRARRSDSSGEVQRAETLMNEASARLPRSLMPRERLRVLGTQAAIKDDLGRVEDSARLRHEALAIADEQPELWRRADARTALAYSYIAAQQYERAQSLIREAIAWGERAQDAYSLAQAHNVDGIVHATLGHAPEQRRSFELAVEYAHRSGSKRDEVGYIANLADIYLKDSEYAMALTQSERALALARELHDPNVERVALANLGLAHIGLHHFEVGKRLVHDAMTIDKGSGAVVDLSDMWQELGTYLEKAGDLPGAVAAYHRYRRLTGDRTREGQQKAVLAMQEKYDAEQRAHQLVLLNREGAIKAELLRRKDLQQRLWWLVIASGLLLLAVVSVLYRKVRSANRQLATTNDLLKAHGECDPLTGLANRRRFQSLMRQLAAEGQPIGTVYLIDIDHFKHINDRHGHGAGDAVLVEVARRLRAALREQDLLVRWGGEEFLAVARGLAPEQVEVLGARLLGVLDQAPVMVGAQGISVTASIGFATFPLGGVAMRISWERAVGVVDAAMYLAKAHGRNRAYGVTWLQALDERSLQGVTSALELANREGTVALSLLQGRVAQVAAA